MGGNSQVLGTSTVDGMVLSDNPFLWHLYASAAQAPPVLFRDDAFQIAEAAAMAGDAIVLRDPAAVAGHPEYTITTGNLIVLADDPFGATFRLDRVAKFTLMGERMRTLSATAATT